MVPCTDCSSIHRKAAVYRHSSTCECVDHHLFQVMRAMLSHVRVICFATSAKFPLYSHVRFAFRRAVPNDSTKGEAHVRVRFSKSMRSSTHISTFIIARAFTNGFIHVQVFSLVALHYFMDFVQPLQILCGVEAVCVLILQSSMAPPSVERNDRVLKFRLVAHH